MCGTIVAILAAHVRKAEIERTRAKPPNSWQAYDYYLQAVEAFGSFHSSFGAKDLHETRRLLEQSLSIDATYARSYALLADTRAAAWLNSLDRDFLNPVALDEAHACARKAVQLNPNAPQARAVLGLILTWRRKYEASVAEVERAIALNPSYVDWRLGMALVFAGESKRAVDVLTATMRLDPFYPPLASGILGFAHHMLKQYSDALPLLRDCVSRAPNLIVGHGWLAATHARLGQLDEARSEATAVLRLQPNYTITGTTGRFGAFKDAKDDKYLYDGLRKAGLPE